VRRSLQTKGRWEEQRQETGHAIGFQVITLITLSILGLFLAVGHHKDFATPKDQFVWFRILRFISLMTHDDIYKIYVYVQVQLDLDMFHSTSHELPLTRNQGLVSYSPPLFQPSQGPKEKLLLSHLCTELRTVSHGMAPLRIAFIHPDLGIGTKLTSNGCFLSNDTYRRCGTSDR